MRRESLGSRRRAVALMMALVVLLVVGLVSGLSLRAILQSHRQTREEAQRVQAELLADAALSRAISMLQQDANWKGERWTVNLAGPRAENADQKTAATDARLTGSAETKIENTTGRADSWRIAVNAIYPNDPVHRAQAQREMAYTIPPRGEKP